MNTRKRKVLDVARSLFIEKGFLETSIMDIINEAKISKGTFYNYFTSKNECLIAILQESREDASNIRHELIFGQDPKDIDILAKQIAVLMYINREQNLLQIFESIYHSRDEGVKKVVIKHHLQELDWLSTRLVEVYGNEISIMSYECAVQVFAMIQHTVRTLAVADDRYVAPEAVIKIVKMALRNIDAIIPRMLETKEVLIGAETIHCIKNSVDHKVVNKNMIINQLKGFIEGLSKDDPKDGIEYANYLLTELQQTEPKLFIIEALLTPFRKSFTKTTHASEAREIANYIWRLTKEEHPIDGN
ncbi:TetR/AcrR family transcriptional regulator [Rummeliibacillus pycnus]|uniref:TetR/AcrR family transcriptional regulator n=1 Tax=Rummeliibacillus pycnus TaxID=101070 RepID=UPI003D2A04C2